MDNKYQHKKPRFVSGVVLISGSQMILIISFFIETMIAVRHLLPEVYGIYVFMVAVTNFLAMLIDIGFRISMTQLIASSPRENQINISNSIINTRLIILITTSILLILIRKNLILFKFPEEAIQLAIYLPMMISAFSIDELMTGALQGFSLFYHISFAILTRGISRVLLTYIFLIVFKMGILSLIYSWIISFIISSVYQYYAIPIPKKIKIDKITILKVIRFGFPIQINRFLSFGSGQVTTLLLSAMTVSKNVAYFGTGQRLPKAFSSISASFITVFFPNMATLYANKQYEKAASVLNQSIRLISFLLSIITLVVVIFSEQIILLLFTDKYLSSNMVMQLLMIAFQIGFVIQLIGFTLTSAGYPKMAMVQNILLTSIIIIGNIVLIPKYGIIGAAATPIIANYFTFPLSVWLLKKKKIYINTRNILKQIFILSFFIIFTWKFHIEKFIIKTILISLFITLNMIFLNISFKDIKLIIPDNLYNRIIPLFIKRQ